MTSLDSQNQCLDFDFSRVVFNRTEWLNETIPKLNQALTFTNRYPIPHANRGTGCGTIGSPGIRSCGSPTSCHTWCYFSTSMYSNFINLDKCSIDGTIDLQHNFYC